MITRKIHYYFSSTYTCFDLDFIDFCNVILVLRVYFRYLSIKSPCAFKWWKKTVKIGGKLKVTSQQKSTPGIWHPSRPMTSRLSRPMTGRPSPPVTPVMASGWNILPTFRSSFSHFLHFLHHKGHDQKYSSWNFCL
jgi:hypothetical protein